MDSSPIVCNSGPLIALSLVGQLQVLPALYNTILVPEAVWHEVVDSGFGRAGAAELKTAQWIEVVPSISVDSFLGGRPWPRRESGDRSRSCKSGGSGPHR
jgi:hypothetical protein